MPGTGQAGETAFFTSWGERGEKTPLLIGRGPRRLGEFGQESAVVGDDTWVLRVDPSHGATATPAGDGDSFVLSGRIGKDKRLKVKLAGRDLEFINERRGDWVVLEGEEPVAQFSSGNRGVRECILEFLPGARLRMSDAQVAALSWFARLVIEEKVSRVSAALIVTLVAASAMALLAIFL